MATGDSTASLPGNEEKKGMDKARRKSWVRTLGSLFRKKSIDSSPTARRFLEAEVQTSSRNLYDEQEEIEPESRETLDREVDVSTMDSRGAPRKKRPYKSVSTGHWSSTDDAPVARCNYSGIHQLKSAGRVLGDEMGEHKITGLRRSSNTTDAATTICQCRQIPQERKPSNAHTLFFRDDDFFAEAELADALYEGKATGHPSNASEERPGKIPRGKIIYSKAGGSDEDTVSFEVSLNDSLMKEVLNSIQVGNIHGGLPKCGQRCTSKKDFEGKCITSTGADDSSEAFSVEIELCDPPEKNGGEICGGAQSDGKNTGGSSSETSRAESTGTREITENHVHEKEDCKSEGALPEGRFTIESNTSSGSTLESYNSYTNEVSKEVVDNARGWSRGGLEPMNGRLSVGQKSKKTSVGSSLNTARPEEDSESEDSNDREVTTPSEKVGVPRSEGHEKNFRKDRQEFRTDRYRGKETVQNHNRSKDERVGETLDRDKKGRKIRKRNIPSNSSFEHRTSSSRTKGRRSKRLRDRAELEIKGRQKAVVKPSTRKGRSACCSCMGNRNMQSTSSQGTETLSAMSGRESGVDTISVSDDGSHSSKDFNGNYYDVNAFYISDDGGRSWNSYSGAKDEENDRTINDNGTHSWRNNTGKSKTAMKSGLKVAKRAGWNLDKAANECKTIGVDSERVAAGIRKCQNSYRNIDPCDDSTHHSFDEAGYDGDAFVHVSKTPEYLEDRGVEFESTCDCDYSGNPPAGRQVHTPKKKTRGCNLRSDWEDTHSDPEQSRGLPSEPLYEDWNASTRDTWDLQAARLEEEQIDQGPKNKWLQRMGKLSVAKELDDYDTQDRKRFIQQETNGFLPERPRDCYLQGDGAYRWDEKSPTNPESSFSHSWQDHKGVMPSDQHLETPTGGFIEEDVQTYQYKQTVTLERNGFLPQDDVGCLGDEWLTSDQQLASKVDSKNLESQDWTASSTKQHLKHTGNRESVAETLKASQSLLQGNVPRKHQCDYSGCCHVQSRFIAEGSLPSHTKVGILRKNPFIVERRSCSPSPKFSSECGKSTNSLENNRKEKRAAHFGRGDNCEDSHRDDIRPLHDDHSRPNVSRKEVTHAGPHMKPKYIAGAIKGGIRETCQQVVGEESCRHEHINDDCEDGSKYSGESKRRRKDKTSFANHEGDLKSSPNGFKCILHKLPSNHLHELKQREAIWKKCQERQEAMLERIEKMSAQAKSCLIKSSNVTADSNQLDDKFQNGLTDSNIADKNSTQSNVQFQNLPSSTFKGPQQEGKTLPGKPKPRGRSISARAGRNYIFPKQTVKRIFKRNESEDSSSDDDIYDQASRKFRDELFKRIPGKDVQCFNSSSQVLTVSCGDCSDLETRKTIEEVQRHLHALSSSDAFRFSSVYKELLRVEDEMKEIAKAFASYAHPEQSDYIGALENSSNSRQGPQPWKCTGRESKRRQPSCEDRGSELVDGSSPELGGISPIFVYKNPLWSKWIRRNTTSCGDPLSVHMAARLIKAEVPIDYENGYKVQYIPADKRGRMGMRDKSPGWEERKRLWLQPVQQERAKPMKNRRPSADSSSSSSCKGEEDMNALQALTSDANYESSSSNSGSELLHRRHRRKVSKEARRIRKQKCRGEYSDSTDSSFWSEDDNPNLDLFVGEAEEQLARLKLAKVQIGNLSPESLAQVRRFYKEPLSNTREKTGSCPYTHHTWIPETCDGESESTESRHGKCAMRKKIRSSIAKKITLKKLTAREIKEFHLLERRVQRELGAAGKNTRPAECPLQEQEGISKRSKEVDSAPSDQVFSLDDNHCIDHHESSKVDLNAFAGKDTKGGKSSPPEQLNGPISSVVKLFFGTQREKPRADEGGSANTLQEVYPMIRRKVELLEAEILTFTKGNRKMNNLLKEQDEHAARLKQEKAAWEQQKASDMEAFQKFKDAQLSKLQKERSKLEQQARTTSKPPRKEDRRALDELKARLAQEQDAHLKKETKWRLTSNRLRKANKDLLEQIHELRKEIGRHEEQILLQLDARESASDTSAQSSQNKKKKNGPHQIKIHNGIPTTGSHLKTFTDNGDIVKVSKDAKSSKEVKYQIASTCDEATTMLTQKMNHLEKDVESWIHFHPDEFESDPIYY